MNTKTMIHRDRDYVSQSRVVRSDDKPIPQWSVHLMRKRSRYGAARTERRGVVLFVAAGPIHFEIGSR